MRGCITCLYMRAHTHMQRQPTLRHTLTTTQLIWSVISSVKAWQNASSLYCCNERSVDRSSTRVWPKGTWPGFKWCIVIKNKTLALTSGKKGSGAKHLAGKISPIGFSLISSSTDTLVVPISPFLPCQWSAPGGGTLACVVGASCYPWVIHSAPTQVVLAGWLYLFGAQRPVRLHSQTDIHY